MGRINRRIYSKRRKRSSAFKMFGITGSDLINQMGVSQAFNRLQGDEKSQHGPTQSPGIQKGGRTGGLGGLSRGVGSRQQYQWDKEAQEMSDFYANKDGNTLGSNGNGGSQDFNANGLNIKITKT